MNGGKKLLQIVIIVFIIMFISGVAYATWLWRNNVDKNIVFNTAKGLNGYIIYNEGESKFVGNFSAVNTYLDGVNTTISISKQPTINNILLSASIHMDIRQIGSNMSDSTALKWIVTKGDTITPGDTLATGIFHGVQYGDDLILVPSVEVTTEIQEYTVWIWLDASEEPSQELNQETLDVVIWTEVNQNG